MENPTLLPPTSECWHSMPAAWLTDGSCCGQRLSNAGEQALLLTRHGEEAQGRAMHHHEAPVPWGYAHISPPSCMEVAHPADSSPGPHICAISQWQVTKYWQYPCFHCDTSPCKRSTLHLSRTHTSLTGSESPTFLPRTMNQ